MNATASVLGHGSPLLPTSSVYTPARVDETGDLADAQTMKGPTTPRAIQTRAPEPGLVLADRYRLIERVGHGGMGTVWRGEHLTLHTPVAIKLINPALLDNPQMRERFVREARAAATLRSPHVVQIFDYGVDQQTPYIAMELLEGESLAQRLQREASLDPRTTLQILTHVLRAIAKAHEAGVVHRDLKPDNVFLVEGDGTELAKVVDFGVAKGLGGIRLGATTNTDTALGTPFYMSPEQMMKSGQVDTQADLWSVAVIAYECLLGRRPFLAESMAELAIAVLVEAPPVPSAHGEVPPGFDAWFSRATAREPEARFADAKQMAQALEVALCREGEAVTLEPLLVDPPSRGRAWVPLAAIGALLLASVGVMLALRDPQPEPRLEPAGIEPTGIEPAGIEPTATQPDPPRPTPPVETVAPSVIEGTHSVSMASSSGDHSPPTGSTGEPLPPTDPGGVSATEDPTPRLAPRRTSHSGKKAKPRAPSKSRSDLRFDIEDLEY